MGLISDWYRVEQLVLLLPGVVGHCQNYGDHIPEDKPWKWGNGNIPSTASIACANILIEANSGRRIQ